MKNLQRREFLSSGIKAFAFLSAKAMLARQNLYADETKFQDFYCDSATQEKKTLIIYESEFGSTQEVAEFIGKTLCKNNFAANVKWVEHVKSLQGYDAVILGSAIQYDAWMESMRSFVTQNEAELQNIPTAYFFTCLTLSKKTREAHLQAQKYAEDLLALSTQVRPLSIGRFAGVLDYSKMSFAFRSMAKVIFFALGVKEGDYKNYKEIASWTQNLYAKLYG